MASELGKSTAQPMYEKENIDGFPTDNPDDYLIGAERIAAFFNVRRRTIYHWVRTSRLPVFRLGSMVCARRSTLIAWIKEQEERIGKERDAPSVK